MDYLNNINSTDFQIEHALESVQSFRKTTKDRLLQINNQYREVVRGLIKKRNLEKTIRLAKQVQMIEQLKTKSGITDDQEFVMQLIDEGERFLLIDEQVPVDFQLEIENDDRRSYDNAIVNARYAFNTVKQALDTNSFIYTESQTNIEDSDPDSSDETDSEEEDEVSPVKKTLSKDQ